MIALTIYYLDIIVILCGGGKGGSFEINYKMNNLQSDSSCPLTLSL